MMNSFLIYFVFFEAIFFSKKNINRIIKMNFKGFEYETTETMIFPSEPLFSYEEKQQSLTMEENSKQSLGIFQFNICQILQWVLFLQEKTKKISNKLFNHCDSDSIMFLAKGKGNVVEEFGNTELKILKKICRGCDDKISFFNEYFVGLYGINYLRLSIPTFSFVYTFSNKPKKQYIQQEYIENTNTFQSFIVNKTLSNNDLFSIFLQLLCSLEFAQNSLFFTHYDLHTDNILIQENVQKESFTVPIFDRDFHFQKPKYIVKIIDFGFSTVMPEKNVIFSNCNHQTFFTKGYFSFFTTGTDMFRFIMSIYSRCPNKEFFQFFIFLFEHFYKFKINIITDENFKQFFHSNYYNIFFSKPVQNTPLELIEFLLLNEQTILGILNIKQYPISMTVHENIEKKQYQKKNIETFKKKFHLKELNIQCLERNPLFSSYQKKNVQPKQKVKDLNFNDIPLFNFHSVSEMEQYYKEQSWFVEWFENYCHEHFISKTPEKYNTKIVQYSKLYKNLISIQSWIGYCKDKRFLKSKENIEFIDKYIDSMTHLM